MNIQKCGKPICLAAPNVSETDPTAPRNISALAAALARFSVPGYSKGDDLQSFCGGIFQKQIAYLVQAPEGWILSTRPMERTLARIARCRSKSSAADAWPFRSHPGRGQINRRFGCQIGCHPQTAPMISDPEFFRGFGFELEIEPVEPDFFIEETAAKKFLGLEMQVLEVPGHCPGSLCFFSPKDQLLIGGDVLFAGGVGRWDLPGGDADVLFDGIRKKIFPLGDNVTVLPGHGPPTKIGTERQTNPFIR
jgi:hypothetical protein